LGIRPTAVALVPAVVALAIVAGQPPTAGATVPSADLATTVTPFNVGPHAVVGAAIGYRITVMNNGPDPASDVVLTDSVNPSMWSRYPTRFYCVGVGVLCSPLPSTVSCTPPPPTSTPGTATCTTGSLSPGTSVTISVGVHVGFYLPHQLICDTASVTFNPNVGNDTGRTCVPIG
jgi:uncharacterized repeat protein (TIGR01451 family)